MKGIDKVIKTIKGMNKKTEKEFDKKWENGDFLVNRHDFEPETSPDAIKAYINEHFIDKKDDIVIEDGIAGEDIKEARAVYKDAEPK